MVMMNKTNPLTIPFKRTVQAGILNKVGGAFQPWLRMRVGSHRRLTGPLAVGFLFWLTPRLEIQIGNFTTDIAVDFLVPFTFLFWIWVPFAILGIGFVLYPQQAIENNRQLRDQLSRILLGHVSQDHLESSRPSQIFVTRLAGILFATVTGLPIIMLFLSWKA
jgi:hypothetical protein